MKLTNDPNIDQRIFSNQIGYYQVEEEYFLNKHEALVYAAKDNLRVSYHWFDQEFNDFDRSQLGKYSLDELYLKRARALREKYEYLILNYSGGTDSWNILKVFLDNNIKLDAIMVSWPLSAVEANLYSPNTKDVSASNFMSEWDFTMKPDIDWIAANYPEIEIEIIDWAKPFFEDPNFVKKELFDQLNHFHNLADLARSTIFSKIEKNLCEQGVKVGTIWGIDKPAVFKDEDGNCFMVFTDSITTVGHAPAWNLNGTEYFYWAPDMPELTFEMAYQTILWFKRRPAYQKFMWHVQNTRNRDRFLQIAQINQYAVRESCYPSWKSKVNTFQVQKPTKPARDDKDFWLYETPSLKHHVDTWEVLYREHLNAVHRRYVIVDPVNNKRTGYWVFFSPWHYICNFNNLPATNDPV